MLFLLLDLDVLSNENPVLHPDLWFFFMESRKTFFNRNGIRWWNRLPDRCWSVWHWRLSGLSARQRHGHIFMNCLMFFVSHSLVLSALSLPCPYCCWLMIFSVKVFFRASRSKRLCIKEYINCFFLLKLCTSFFFGLLLCCFSVLILGALLHLYLSQDVTLMWCCYIWQSTFSLSSG